MPSAAHFPCVFTLPTVSRFPSASNILRAQRDHGGAFAEMSGQQYVMPQFWRRRSHYKIGALDAADFITMIKARSFAELRTIWRRVGILEDEKLCYSRAAHYFHEHCRSAFLNFCFHEHWPLLSFNSFGLPLCCSASPMS